jgi:hypothetical protein
VHSPTCLILYVYEKERRLRCVALDWFDWCIDLIGRTSAMAFIGRSLPISVMALSGECVLYVLGCHILKIGTG